MVKMLIELIKLIKLIKMIVMLIKKSLRHCTELPLR